LIYAILLFSCGLLTPRALLSFPTRRSSDLLAVVGHEAPFDHGREQMHLLAGLSVTTKAVERTAEAIREDIAARQAENMQRAAISDRKSTRLNSSHGSISYAVFCLKKKKNTM